MKKIFITILLTVIGIGVAHSVSAEITYNSLVDLPMPSGSAGDNLSTEDFVKILYALSISLGGLLAVIKIIFGGVKYMLSDVITDKSSAKKDIYGALLGLLIIISAVLILNTINPRLTELNLFKNAPAVNIQSGGTSQNVTGNLKQNLDTLKCPNGGNPVVDSNQQLSCKSNEEVSGSTNITNGASPVFNSLPFDGQAFIDIRERTPELRDVDISNIKGFLSADWSTPEGSEILKDYDGLSIIYEDEVLRPACGESNRLIKLHTFSSSRYYCVNG